MGAYIGDALQSVQAQTYKDYEVIIVDDGSTDEHTIRQLKSIGKQSPEIHIYYKENSGLSGAKNYGIERANGEYIVCLDADDKLEPTYLEKTVELIERKKSENVAFVTTWVQEFGHRDDIWRTSGFDMPKLLITNLVHAGSIFRKDVWKEVGGFKKVGASYEDWEFWISIVEKGYKWDIVEELLFLYRIRTNSLLASAKSSHLEIYKTIYDLHPQVYMKYAKELAIENAREIKELREVISEKNKSINEILDARDFYRGRALNAEERLEAFLRSRTVRIGLKLIKLSALIRAKMSALRSRFINFLRSLIPQFAKRLARRAFDLAFPKELTVIKNEQWSEGQHLISVITPYYNHAASIRDTAESVFYQTYRSIEYIIIDDGSNEEHSKALNQIKGKSVKIVHLKENIGKGSPAAARNYGIERASGKYIVCLDSDDLLDPTFIEKCLVILETQPDIGLATTDIQAFGAADWIWDFHNYNPMELLTNNLVITAAMFKKEAWQKVGGYKKDIGYEDWEFWISLAEKGFFGKHLAEKLFKYRVADTSRYKEDKKRHRHIVEGIHELHPKFKKNIRTILKEKKKKIIKVDPNTAFINLDRAGDYYVNNIGNNVLIAIPWMTFGGAETLILNFCNEIKDSINISFVTGLSSQHEWEHKFKKISPNVYHLENMFGEDKKMYLEYISNYISTRRIDVLHIVHTSFMFDMLPEIKKRHPNLKVIVTLFNTRAHFEESVGYEDLIDRYGTDNSLVANQLQKRLKAGKPVTVISNGINSNDTYNPALFDRSEERRTLGIKEKEISIFFAGRLSEEKNPDLFIEVAEKILAKESSRNLKFFIIGDGSLRGVVEKMISGIDSDNIKYLGYQSDIARYLSAADIFVLPSSIEGFPLSILEAMAMRVAVIASDVGAVSQIVDTGENGIVVPPASIEDFIAAIEKLNSSPKLLEKLKNNARRKVEEKYSNIILGENYKKLYKEVLR